MAEADPTNELGHFSLGKALLDAGRFSESVGSLSRVIELNPNMARAYQFLAAGLLKLNRRDEAIERLKQGVEIARSRGETMPLREMTGMLKELGVTIAEPESTAKVAVGDGQVHCRRCGNVAPKLPKPPMKSAFGQEVYENICASCWREAIGVGTKVINELRLPLGDPQAGKVWDQHIREFLNLTGGH